MSTKSCFGTYDIRGIYPETVNEELAYRIGRFLPRLVKGTKIVVGRDVRLSSKALQEALIRGLLESGCDVYDLGLCGTEMIYFAVPHLALAGGVMITASHNPKAYNGMKFVGRGSAPLEKEIFRELERQVLEEKLPVSGEEGVLYQTDIMADYVAKMLSYANMSYLKRYKVVVNAGNGSAGPVLEAMEKYLPFELVKLGCTPDGTFPQGVPNPLLPENRAITAEAVKKHGADFGVAWDGDFDRCFIYDEQGRFIDACYMVGCLAEAFLIKEPGAGIVYDPRVVFKIEDTILSNGGKSAMCRVGHVFFKSQLREKGAIYGGEMSGHHYFRDFYYCDSGMIPWLLMAELLSRSGRKLSEFVGECREKYPVSGEQNLKVENVSLTLERMEGLYGNKGCVSKVDGLSVDMGEWRFNLRPSHTEPLLRLNVESRRDRKLCEDKTREIISTIAEIS